MPRNLESKIINLLDDVETLGKAEAVKRVKKLIEEEISFLGGEHSIEKCELNNIRSVAIDYYRERDPRRLPDNELFLAECYLDSILSYLKSKGYIKFNLKFKAK